MPHPFTIIDVFTDVALAGNQLAVFEDGAAVPDELLQPIAREIGFSETVFVYAGDRIRIFTPDRELPFAGHPVLGTAKVLAIGRAVSEVTLVTGRGPIVVTHDAAGRGRMVQPVPVVVDLPSPEADLVTALGAAAAIAPVECYDNGPRHIDVVLASTDEVRGLRPDHTRLAELSPEAGVSVVAGEGARWRTRYFFPGGGVPEDPATGSAAGPIAVHLARHGLVAWGTEITLEQGAEMKRPSRLSTVAHGGADAVERVEVGGDSVIVGRGELDLP